MHLRFGGIYSRKILLQITRTYGSSPPIPDLWVFSPLPLRSSMLFSVLTFSTSWSKLSSSHTTNVIFSWSTHHLCPLFQSHLCSTQDKLSFSFKPHIEHSCFLLLHNVTPAHCLPSLVTFSAVKHTAPHTTVADFLKWSIFSCHNQSHLS